METRKGKKGRKGPRPQTSIKMEPEVAEYLERLAELMQRDRTFLINAIVSEHAHRHRGKLPPRLQIISI
ncbi:MAG: hypothetical protein K8R23_01240 [Chthoniobacter sp.]|nr:hypothetical protein [Chthoniobacter sp.]